MVCRWGARSGRWRLSERANGTFVRAIDGGEVFDDVGEQAGLFAVDTLSMAKTKKSNEVVSEQVRRQVEVRAVVDNLSTLTTRRL